MIRAMGLFTLKRERESEREREREGERERDIYIYMQAEMFFVTTLGCTRISRYLQTAAALF